MIDLSCFDASSTAVPAMTTMAGGAVVSVEVKLEALDRRLRVRSGFDREDHGHVGTGG